MQLHTGNEHILPFSLPSCRQRRELECRTAATIVPGPGDAETQQDTVHG